MRKVWLTAAVVAGFVFCAGADVVIHELGSLSDQPQDVTKGWSLGNFSNYTANAVYVYTNQMIGGETFDYTLTITAGTGVTDLGFGNGGLVDSGSGADFFQNGDEITASVAVSGNSNVVFDGFVNFGINYGGTGEGFTIDGVDYIRGTATNGDSDPRQGIAIAGGIIATDSVDIVFIAADDAIVLRGMAYQFSFDNPVDASFTVSTNAGVYPLAVTFDASASSAVNGIDSYNWDLGDGTLTNGSVITHTYQSAGEFEATLTVVDTLSNSNSAMEIITVGAPISPVISVSTNLAAIPAEIIFDGTGSTAVNGIASYVWDFGDGNTGTGGIATNTYTADGTFTATLSVIDSLGDSNSVTTNVMTYYLPADVAYSSAQSDEADVPAISTNDLGQTAFLSITNASGIWTSNDPADALFNGSLTNETRLYGGAAFTIVLDTSINGLGYDISMIETVFGSGTAVGGRANQAYSVTVTYMDDSTEKILGKKVWEDNLDPTTYWTKVTFSNTTDSVLASGVKAVTFAEFDSANSAAYGDFLRAREFDVFGTPTTDLSGSPVLGIVDGALVWDTPIVMDYEIQVLSNLVFGTWATYSNVTATPPKTSVELPLGRADSEFFRVISE